MNPRSSHPRKLRPAAAESLRSRSILRLYRALIRAYGKQHWWPAQSPLEMVLGAYLTQNTSWKNVEKALHRLRGEKLLSLPALRKIPQARLARLIRSSGYFRQKAARIKFFLDFLSRRHHGSLRRMFSGRDPVQLREQLLQLHGVGPETADSILLYAGQLPVFVVDAYTRRIFARHGILPANASYDELRLAVERAFQPARLPLAQEMNAGHPPSRLSRASRPALVQHFNEFHALLVQVGKCHCHKNHPDCAHCPLRSLLPDASLVVIRKDDASHHAARKPKL